MSVVCLYDTHGQHITRSFFTGIRPESNPSSPRARRGGVLNSVCNLPVCQRSNHKRRVRAQERVFSRPRPGTLERQSDLFVWSALNHMTVKSIIQYRDKHPLYTGAPSILVGVCAHAVAVSICLAISSAFSLLYRISTSLSANCRLVPGPWLVTTLPSPTACASVQPGTFSLKASAG